MVVGGLVVVGGWSLACCGGWCVVCVVVVCGVCGSSVWCVW